MPKCRLQSSEGIVISVTITGTCDCERENWRLNNLVCFFGNLNCLEEENSVINLLKGNKRECNKREALSACVILNVCARIRVLIIVGIR